jgi:hypothetical protein
MYEDRGFYLEKGQSARDLIDAVSYLARCPWMAMADVDASIISFLTLSSIVNFILMLSVPFFSLLFITSPWILEQWSLLDLY